MSQQRMRLLQSDDLFGNPGLMILKDLAPLQRSRIAKLTQLRVALHLANRHIRGSHAVEEVQPSFVCIGIAAVTIACPSHRLNQSHSLVITQRVRGHTASISHAPYGVT